MGTAYDPCPCGSGKKFKFCCQAAFRDDPAEGLKRAASFPLVYCLVHAQWREAGITPVAVARAAPDQSFIFAAYSVDWYCLGVKDAFGGPNISRAKVEHYRTTQPALIDFPYEDARSLVLGAVDFAKGLGLEPAQEWGALRHIIEAERPYAPKFTFGKDGKPFYVSGPYDNPEEVLRKLKGKPHDFVIGGPDADWDEDLMPPK